MKAKKKVALSRDPKKENIFREISGVLREAGYVVRREKLKQGPGWKVVSGACRVNDQRLIFVDPRLSQDDQILFLKSRAVTFGVTLEPLSESESESESEVSSALSCSP